jgi:hypothetical protein
MVRILILYFERRIWPELFAMIGLFFVERLLGALAMEVLVQRLGLLALSVATAAFFVWVLRTQAQTKLGLDPPAQRWTRLLFVVALVASIVAIPLNLYGNLGLALAIQSAVVRCVLLAATLRAFVVVVREVGRLATHALEQRGWRAIARHRTAMMDRLDTLTVVGGAIIWAYYTLVMMRVDEIVLGALRTALGAEAKIGEVTLSVSRVLAFVAAVSC